MKSCAQSAVKVNPLNNELIPICHLLVLLGVHHILNVSRIRANLSVQVANSTVPAVINTPVTLVKDNYPVVWNDT